MPGINTASYNLSRIHFASFDKDIQRNSLRERERERERETDDGVDRPLLLLQLRLASNSEQQGRIKAWYTHLSRAPGWKGAP